MRAQGFITQLIFEHALRIRVKADAGERAQGKDGQPSQGLADGSGVPAGKSQVKGSNMLGKINNRMASSISFPSHAVY